MIKILDKHLDKIIPATCLILSVTLLSAAFYIHAEATSQNVITKNGAGETNDKALGKDNIVETKNEALASAYGEIYKESEVTRDSLLQRFNAYKEGDIATIIDLIKSDKRASKVKVLIVPGHDYEFSGAIFNSIKEADLNLKIGSHLKGLLEQDGNFLVYTTRDPAFIKNDTDNPQDKNAYTDYFQKYLDENIFSVLAYRSLFKIETEKKNLDGALEPLQIVQHNKAPGEMLYRLYAINKFVEDNQIDIVLHLHLNDYPGRGRGAGEYSGFSLYVPDDTLRNGKSSQELAGYLAESIEGSFEFSNNPIEELGIIPGSELIAIGANNTIRAMSVLIEYGYMYEEKFMRSPQNEATFKLAAEKTYLGLKDYFGY